MSHHEDSEVLHESAVIGVGGNGIVLKQSLNGRNYAIKWVSVVYYIFGQYVVQPSTSASAIADYRSTLFHI
jgi:hypothetical protein